MEELPVHYHDLNYDTGPRLGDILAGTLAIALAAFCVWLAVRIINRREQWAKRAAWWLAIGLPVLYVASFGPVWGLAVESRWSGLVSPIYSPLFWMEANGPDWIWNPLYDYFRFCAGPDFDPNRPP